VPWDKGAPHHLLERWLREREVSGDGGAPWWWAAAWAGTPSTWPGSGLPR
jgi:hypothetical protein